MLLFLYFNSCRYFAKKCIVSSTEIPKAILNTNIVDGLIEIPKYPIIEAVIRSGIKLGIKETTTILKELNIQAIKIDINSMAKNRLINRFLTK